jgi:hypothetical protein
MPAFDIAKARIGMAKSALLMRVEAQRLLDIAVATSDHREARSWQAQLRKIDKMIAQYGLERYAE